MQVIGRDKIRTFGAREPRALEPLTRWVNLVESAAWSHPAELRLVVGSADFVRGFTIFDIGGNKFRLVAIVNYRQQFVAIKYILTHAEYDKGAWKK